MIELLEDGRTDDDEPLFQGARYWSKYVGIGEMDEPIYESMYPC
jgi:hypothetical protein